MHKHTTTLRFAFVVVCACRLPRFAFQWHRTGARTHARTQARTPAHAAHQGALLFARARRFLGRAVAVWAEHISFAHIVCDCATSSALCCVAAAAAAAIELRRRVWFVKERVGGAVFSKFHEPFDEWLHCAPI